MKKNKLILSLIVGIIIISLSNSCKKFLDKKSDSSLSVPTTLKDFQALLDDDVSMNQGTPSLGEASADDYFLINSTYNSSTDRDKQIYRWQLQEYKYQNDWSKCYLSIASANICLEGLEKIVKTSINEIEWNNVKGSALFFRAYYFLHLSWLFAKAYDENSANTDLGIVLRMTTDFNVPSNRASVKASYDQIIKDTKEAVSLLPNNSQHVMRPSKAAAYALLARTYHSMQKYDSALKYADLSLAIKNSLLDYNSVNTSSTVPFTQKFSHPEIIFYTQMNTLITNHYSIKGFIDSTLYVSYDYDDLRKSAFFRPNSGYQRFKGSYAASGTFLFTGLATDEVYLIKSECHAHLGNKDMALNSLNTLLVTRWKNSVPYPPITAGDVNEALSKILIERRKELLMRGIRWADIKKLNKENSNIILRRLINNQSYILQPNSSYYALPIPLDIIQNSGIQQN